MSFIVTFIAAVFVFSAVIAIHEFGHFIVAKLCGVQVNEFSIGMGPVLCKRVRKGTQYSIRALPVGGYVALEGEESPESKQAEERSNPSAADGGSSPDRGALGLAETSPEEEKPAGIPLNEAPVWQRALIMLAGAGMNLCWALWSWPSSSRPRANLSPARSSIRWRRTPSAARPACRQGIRSLR